ncbi:MAG: hypothetical protein LC114_12120 [Bryobacterales bacterium]|nr:hypothetical protein [Bryobacterales bacterium]
MRDCDNPESCSSTDNKYPEEADSDLRSVECNLLRLEDLKEQILQAICGGCIPPVANLISIYGATLQSLLECPTTRDMVPELESRHTAFFEHLKALLFASRIETRLELERMRATRQYNVSLGRTVPKETWHG